MSDRRLDTTLRAILGDRPQRRWAFFEGFSSIDSARSWGTQGDFAVHQVQGKAYLIAKDASELVYAASCVGADPRPVRHPLDRRAAALLSPSGVRSAAGIVQRQEADGVSVSAHPLWRSFPPGMEAQAVQWAQAGNLGLLTSESDGSRWLAGPWPLMQSFAPRIERRKAKERDRVGWVQLRKESVWREAFALCSRDEPKTRRGEVNRSMILGVSGFTLPRDAYRPRDLWTDLVMEVGRRIQILRPGLVVVGGCPWTDAAALFYLAEEGWPFRARILLPSAWDLDLGRYEAGDVDAHIESLRGNMAFRGGADATAAARELFLSRDLGSRLNEQHIEFQMQTGVDSLSLIAQGVERSLSRQGRVTYQIEGGFRRAADAIARASSQLVTTSLIKDRPERHVARATRLCVGHKHAISFDRHVPPDLVIPP